MKGQFLLDNRFAQVVLDRLRRNNTSVSHFRARFSITEAEMSNIMNGSVPFTSHITFNQLDRFFNTRIGYWKEVYENTHKLALAEISAEPIAEPNPGKDTVIVPVELLESLYDIACEHNYPIAADACEILTKHKKDNA